METSKGLYRVGCRMSLHSALQASKPQTLSPKQQTLCPGTTSLVPWCSATAATSADLGKSGLKCPEPYILQTVVTILGITIAKKKKKRSTDSLRTVIIVIIGIFVIMVIMVIYTLSPKSLDPKTKKKTCIFSIPCRVTLPQVPALAGFFWLKRLRSFSTSSPCSSQT